MIIELAAVVSAVNTAASALNKVASTTSDIQQISGFLGSLGSAQTDLNKIKASKTLSHADALTHSLAQKKINESMKELKEAFIYSGNADLWDEAMLAVHNSKKSREKELRRLEAIKAKKNKELQEILTAVVMGLVVAPFVIGLLILAIIKS